MSITTDATEIRKIVRLLWSIKCQWLDSLEEGDAFLEIYSLPRLNHEELECLHTHIGNKGTEYNVI